jgi:hypothetical protein
MNETISMAYVLKDAFKRVRGPGLHLPKGDGRSRKLKNAWSGGCYAVVVGFSVVGGSGPFKNLNPILT